MFLLFSVAFGLVVLGFVGLVVPGLPGAPILFLGLVAAAWAEDFGFVGWRTLLVLGGMAALTYVVDLAAAALGANVFGGSKRALGGAAVGAFVGVFFGLPGVLLGPFLGAMIGEFTTGRGIPKSGMAGLGATLGFMVGAVAKFALAVSMVGVFLLVRFG